MDKVTTQSASHVARIIALAERTLGSAKAASTWLEHPMQALGGRTPLEAAGTEQGALRVEQILLQAEHGMLG